VGGERHLTCFLLPPGNMDTITHTPHTHTPHTHIHIYIYIYIYITTTTIITTTGWLTDYASEHPDPERVVAEVDAFMADFDRKQKQVYKVFFVDLKSVALVSV